MIYVLKNLLFKKVMEEIFPELEYGNLLHWGNFNTIH